MSAKYPCGHYHRRAELAEYCVYQSEARQRVATHMRSHPWGYICDRCGDGHGHEADKASLRPRPETDAEEAANRRREALEGMSGPY